MTLIASSDKERKQIEDKVLVNNQDHRYASYKTPTSADEWWSVVEVWWDDLLLIMEKFLPMAGFADKDNSILSTTLREHIIKLKQAKKAHLAMYFDSAWNAAPDSGWIHGIKGWDVLCDLCSEQYVLEEK